MPAFTRAALRRRTVGPQCIGALAPTAPFGSEGSNDDAVRIGASLAAADRRSTDTMASFKALRAQTRFRVLSAGVFLSGVRPAPGTGAARHQ